MAVQVDNPGRRCTFTVHVHAHLKHTGGTTDVDFNPQRPEFMVSSGNDRFAKLWDLRKASEPLVKVLTGHSHWVSTARYNPVHDQLIATGGTDNMVNLWRVASCGKAPWLGTARVAMVTIAATTLRTSTQSKSTSTKTVYTVWPGARPVPGYAAASRMTAVLSCRTYPPPKNIRSFFDVQDPRSSLPDCEGFPLPRLKLV